jgi:hypothetical protein
MEFNPKLKVGDNVTLLYMKGETMSPGLKGIVKGVENVFNEDIITVDWENGRKLSLLSTEDAWTLNPPEKIEEAYKDEWLSKNLDIANFDTNVLTNYLIKVRDSGITNMFGAAPYLYMGKDRIEHEFHYKEFDENKQQRFDEMLEIADEAQSEMINGVIKILEKENKELSIENINRYLQKYSQKILMHYINVLS